MATSPSTTRTQEALLVKSPLISAASLGKLLATTTTTHTTHGSTTTSSSKNNALKILDARGQWKEPTGPLYDDYKESHIPGAIFCDWTREFIDTKAERLGLGNVVADAQDAKASFARLGIQKDDQVVVYDAYNHMISARIWWSMRAWGFENVLVLDGGWDAWKAHQSGLLPVSTAIPTNVPSTTDFEPIWQAHYEAPLDRVSELKDSEQMVLMDCRKATGYAGNAEDPRSGHIPGAINVPWVDLLKDDGTYKDATELRQIFDELVGPTWSTCGNVVASCGSGYCAAIVLLAMEKAGVQAPMFDGSVALWRHDETRPMEQN